MTIRRSAVAGTFYPNTAQEVLQYIHHFNQSLQETKTNLKAKALIVPHAGYIYSGFTANMAYSLCKENQYKRIIVIGPSHRVYLQNASISTHQSYETPLGEIAIDKEYVSKLQEKFAFLHFNQDAHHEHSTETQAPFIKHYFKEAKLVEIVYGEQESTLLSELIEYCMQDEESLLVISTDLSHFYSLKEANYLDNICLNAIEYKKPELLDSGCEACGMIGIQALLQSVIKRDLTVQLLNYTTSFEQSQDANSVVGYCSFIIGE